ncbi:MAG TPA: aminoacyl-tRNA hydrolase [Chthoniobacterales bacterium]
MGGVRLVAGLGNPGREYDQTRHNIGFTVLDALAGRHGLSYARSSSWACHWCRWEDVLLVKPLNYMNRSGECLGPFSRFHKILAPEILVVVDDVALPLGRLRLRTQGSDGGHNGLRSIIDHLGASFGRLRIGVGAADPGRLVDHVLGKFHPDERGSVNEAVTRACNAIETVCRDGIPAAMNLFNRAAEGK